MPTDIVFVNPGGREKVYQTLGSDLTAIEPPLWCRLLGGYARDRGHTVAIVDSEAEALGPERVAERIRGLDPTLIVMVVFGHQPSASTQQMVSARETCAAIKALIPSSTVLIVGGHVSALPERTLREEPVDFVCKGEGPETVVRLLQALKAGNSPEIMVDVPGLVWFRDGAVVTNPPAALIENLAEDLHGNVWDLLPMDRYRAHNWQCFGDLASRQPYASIYTSLGCPYKCSFCCINAPFDTNRYRMRSAVAVVEEIDLLYHTYGVKTYKVVDEMFVLNERHVSEICDLLIARGYDLNIWAYARVDTIKPAILSKLRQAGFRWLALGIESGSKHVRDSSMKALRNDDIFAVINQIQHAGIHVIGNFIFGLPNDDIQSMTETLSLAKALNCEFANFYSAMAYPGSPLYKSALERGWDLPESWSGFSQHSYDCRPLPTNHISAEDVLAFRDAAFHDYFSNARYLDSITQRFGWDTRRHIESMAEHRLARRLLEVPAQAAE